MFFEFVMPVKTGIHLTPLEKTFRDFFIAYAKSYNKRFERTGSLFQYKFKRKPADDIAHLFRAGPALSLEQRLPTTQGRATFSLVEPQPNREQIWHTLSQH